MVVTLAPPRFIKLTAGATQRRRRPPPRLNAFASSSSSITPLSSSVSSSTYLSTCRPRVTRNPSSFTPDRDRDKDREHYPIEPLTPSRKPPPYSHGRSRSLSNGTGIESLGSLGSPQHGEAGISRLGWVPTASPRQFHIENLGQLVDSAQELLRVLREVGKKEGKGKGKERDREGDRGLEPWGCMTKIAEMIKKSEALVEMLDPEEVVYRWVGVSTSV